MSPRWLAHLGLASMLVAGCAIDTELGLAVDVRAARVQVRADAEGEVVTASLDLDYRVGAYAERARELRPQSIEIFLSEDARVVSFPPDRPAGFVPRVDPGESRRVTLRGSSPPGEAADPRQLCGRRPLVLFRWVDAVTNEVGLSEVTGEPTGCD